MTRLQPLRVIRWPFTPVPWRMTQPWSEVDYKVYRRMRAWLKAYADIFQEAPK